MNIVSFHLLSTHPAFDYYPFVDKTRMGNNWNEGTYTPVGATAINAFHTACFFDFMHHIIWREVAKRDYILLDDRVTTVNRMLQDPRKCLHHLPLDELDFCFNHFCKSPDEPIPRLDRAIIDKVILSKIMPEFLIYCAMELPEEATDFQILSIFFTALIHQQLIVEDQLGGNRPPLKIVDKFGRGLVSPRLSLETSFIYPCAIHEDRSTIVLGDTNENYLLLKPLQSQIENLYESS